jgi:protein XagA
MRITGQREGAQRLALALFGALSWPTSAMAGAWLQPEGAGQVIFGPSLMEARQRFDRRGRARRTDRFVKTENTTLIEYGFRENLTLLLVTRQRTEAFRQDGEDQRGSTTTLGFGARVPLWRQGRFILSAQVSGESGLERTVATALHRFGPRHEVDARLLAGQGFELFGVDAFVEAQVGYRWRSGTFADEARVDLTLGVRPHPQLLLLVQSLNALGLVRTPGSDGRMRQHKLQASAVVSITERWSVQAGVYGSVAARNALRERGVMLNVWRKF